MVAGPPPPNPGQVRLLVCSSRRGPEALWWAAIGFQRGVKRLSADLEWAGWADRDPSITWSRRVRIHDGVSVHPHTSPWSMIMPVGFYRGDRKIGRRGQSSDGYYFSRSIFLKTGRADTGKEQQEAEEIQIHCDRKTFVASALFYSW